MKKKIKIIVANPAGNITIFVKDKFQRSQYQKVAKQLLAMNRLGGEQVAFILETPTCGRADGKMEMCGLEFCGNASRAFALIKAREMNIVGEESIFVDISGCNEILQVEVNTETKHTKVKMPNPLSITEMELRKLTIHDIKANAQLYDVKPKQATRDDSEMLLSNDGRLNNAVNGGQQSCLPDNVIPSDSAVLVDLGGIMHVIVQGMEATNATFDVIKNMIMTKFDPPAMGVMFYNPKDSSLIPVVYVKDVNTTYFEGSCGSGVTACSAALGIDKGEGIHNFTFNQPKGIINSTVEVVKGEIKSVYIEGEVEISREIEVEIQI